MTRTILLASAAALLAATIPAAASAQSAEAQTACPAPKPRKKGFGLGGLLSAAREAGVGNLMGGGGMFGSGKGGQILGAVAGTAVNAAETGHVDAGSLASSVAGQGKAGQIAGAVAGTAVQLAQNARPGCGAGN